MNLPRPIGHGLATVAVLGVFTAALCGVTLYRIIAFSMAQRVERAREAAVEELATLHGAGPDESQGASPAMIGMRGGIATLPEPAGARAPTDWRGPPAGGGGKDPAPAPPGGP